MLDSRALCPLGGVLPQFLVGHVLRLPSSDDLERLRDELAVGALARDPLRSTFASNALAAGVTVFELAKLMGTSGAMIERSYGTLIGGAHTGLVGRLDAIEASLSAQAEQREEGEGR